MKKITVVKSTEVEVKPFMLDDFIQIHQACNTEEVSKKVTKKELKIIASDMQLDYSDADITFGKKLINAYLAKR